jgi:hypothetical protein
LKNLKGKAKLEKHGHEWKNNVKMDLQEIDLSDSR